MYGKIRRAYWRGSSRCPVCVPATRSAALHRTSVARCVRSLLFICERFCHATWPSKLHGCSSIDGSVARWPPGHLSASSAHVNWNSRHCFEPKSSHSDWNSVGDYCPARLADLWTSRPKPGQSTPQQTACQLFSTPSHLADAGVRAFTRLTEQRIIASVTACVPCKLLNAVMATKKWHRTSLKAAML